MTLYEFLSVNIGVVSLVVVAVIILLFILLILILTKSNIRKIGPFEFSVKTADQYADRFMRVVERVRECERDITRMVEGDILREQMRVAEISIADIVRELKKTFIDLANDRTTEENHRRATEEINTYTLRSEIVADDLKYEFRRSFRQNHFIEKTPKEFSEYINREIEIMTLIIEDSIDHRYSSDLIDLKELREVNRNMLAKSSKFIEAVYFEAREIASMYNIRIKCKREEIKTLISSFLSGAPIDDFIGCIDT